MLFANCHFHSKFSDGEYYPEELARLARRQGYRAVMLTDHDTVRGNWFMQKAARMEGLLSLSACEFTVDGPGYHPHLLGVDFNPDHPAMRALLARASVKSTERTRLLFEAGLERGTLRRGVTWQDVLNSRPYNDYFCNNQVFDLMVERGIYQPEEYSEFFHTNFIWKIDATIPAIGQLKNPGLEETVQIILKAGGVPVVAHPHGLQRYADELVEMGVMGFETCHPEINDEDIAFFDAYCDEHRLYKLGGTDHFGVLGGLTEKMPHLDVPPERGFVTEENFMRLYRRELG